VPVNIASPTRRGARPPVSSAVVRRRGDTVWYDPACSGTSWYPLSYSAVVKLLAHHVHSPPLQETAPPPPQPFYGPCFWDYLAEPVPEEKLLDFMAHGEINRGRHTDHPAGRHSIRTNQCRPPPSSPIFHRPDALPAAQPTVSRH